MNPENESDPTGDQTGGPQETTTTASINLNALQWQPFEVLDPPDPALVLATVRTELERCHPALKHRLEVDTTLWTGEDDGTTYDLVFEPDADSPEALAAVATLLESQAVHNGGQQTFGDSYYDGYDPVHLLVLGSAFVVRVLVPYQLACQLVPWARRGEGPRE